MTNGSCQSRCESNVQTWLNPWVSARRASSTVREAGGFVCRTTPKSTGLLSDQVLGQATLEEPAVARPPVVGAVLDEDGPAGQHGVDVAVDLEPLPRGVVHVHVM